MLNLDGLLKELMNTTRERRLVDGELDEICRDFEVLAIDYNRVAQLPGDDARRQQTAICESLKGLEEEISRKLRRYEERD